MGCKKRVRVRSERCERAHQAFIGLRDAGLGDARTRLVGREEASRVVLALGSLKLSVLAVRGEDVLLGCGVVQEERNVLRV